MTTPPYDPGRADNLRRPTARPAGRRRRRRDWGRFVATVICGVLAVLGCAPFAATLVGRSAWARSWATQQTEALLRAQGIDATYQMAFRVWPFTIELNHLRLQSSDGGSPAVECDRVRIRPKLFGLLAGKVAIAQVELDSPRVRLEWRDGKLANLRIKPLPRSSGPTRSPFGSLSLTEASVDLRLDGAHLQAASVDLDVTSDDEMTEGSSFEVALRAGRLALERARSKNESPALDEDALCSVEARVRVQPDSILVRRLEAAGSADLDLAPGTGPGCDLPPEDERRVELSLGNLHIVPDASGRAWPTIDGHLRVRAPVALAQRFADLPDIGGWVSLDADLQYGQGSVLPDVAATLEARGLHLARYAFAQEIHSVWTLRNGVFESPQTTLRLASGTITLSDTVLEPLSKGFRIEKMRLDASGVDFTDLLRKLGVHPNPHVGWEIREVHAPLLSGTLVPLKLDGDFTAKTYSFGIYDRPADDPSRQRVFGFAEALVAARLALRPEGIRFVEVHAALPHSRIDGASVYLGFHGDLRVDAPRLLADLDDVSPIGPVAMHGKLSASARVGGAFTHPEPEGDIEGLAGLSIADVNFGDLGAGHVKVDVEKPELEITGLHAKRRESSYEVPTATLRFGGARGFTVDAVGTSGAFGLRDALSMFALDDDPRFEGLGATVAMRANVHVALGGPEDACGGGYIGVDLRGGLSNVVIYGERFARGDADVSLRWYDRQHGIAGAELDVRSFVLDKTQAPLATRAATTGTLLGSAVLRRGGALTANVMIEGVPLSRVDALGAFASDAEGRVSGVAHVAGDLDAFHAGAGFVARAELDVAGTRVRGVPLAGSHLAVRMTHHLTQAKQAIGRTNCGGLIAPPFDRAAYLAEGPAHEDWALDGDLMGGTARLRNVTVTRGKSLRMAGTASLRGLDVGALSRIWSREGSEADEVIAAPARRSVEGQLWGELVAEDISFDHPSTSRIRLLLGPTVLSRRGQKMMLQPLREPLELADDRLTVPPLELTLETPDGFRGNCVLSGSVTHVTTDPTLALEAQLDPMDLAILQRMVPKVERASGTVSGSLRVTGRALSPVVAGELHAVGDAIEVHGLPSAITDVRVDVAATSTELSLSGAAKFAGGTVALAGSMPIRGLSLGALDSSIVARGIRLAPAEGIAATFDADLDVHYEPKPRGPEGASLPLVTGDVTVSSFDYTRPISLTTELTALGGRAKRTQIDAYDPSLDFVSFDVRVLSRRPFAIKSNLVETQLAIDSGALQVTGTNQRLGLRGVLRALPGGRFHFQQSDFEVSQGLIRFEDPTRVAANVDVTAVTEYRRYTDTAAAAAAGVATSGGTTGASIGSTRGGSLWRITLHAYGDADNLRVEMTSEPTLSQEDIVLLLAVGMTRTELDQLEATNLGASLALNYLGAASGADRAVKQALPIIDDFRFGSAYSTVTGRTEPQLTVGKRLTNDFRANLTAGLSADRELRANIEWRLNNRLSLQGSYDNINDVSSSALGNLGVDLRWRLEFE